MLWVQKKHVSFRRLRTSDGGNGNHSVSLPIILIKFKVIHGSWLGVLYAWMNGYSTLLHNIAPGKYIVIKVEYELQLRFKIFLKKSDRKKQQQK